MIAIYKRELSSYFRTVIGEVFIGLNFLIFGFFFLRYNLLGLSSNLNGALYNTAFIGLVFMIPLLCMRSFSEEKRLKTDQLIMTAPVSVAGIVLGKFLAIATVFSLPTALTLILPPLMGRFGDVPYLWNYADILDYWLYGLMIISICIFISSLTENQIVAVVISVVVLLACNLLGETFEGIKISWLKDILNSTINFNGRLMTIYMGSFDLTSIVFFVSVTVLFLFLTGQVLQKRRFTVSKGNFTMTAYSTATVLLVIALVVGANVAILQIPDEIREVDLTASRMYSLSKESREIAAGITDDVTLYFLARENDEASETRDLTVDRILKNYASAGSHVTLTYIDPSANTKFYQKYTDTDPGYSGVIVVNGTNGRSKAVPYNDMYRKDFDYQTYSQRTTASDIEGQITGALQYVTMTESDLVQAYATSGHGEMELENYYKKILENANIHLQGLELLKEGQVPEDCGLLIIDAPRNDFTPSEEEAVEAYLSKGGDILIVTAPDAMPGSMPNFGKLLNWYGITLTDGVVLDYTQGNYYATFGTPSYLLPNLSLDDEITSEIANSALQTVFMPEAQGILFDEQDEISYTRLLTSSDESFLSTDAQDAPSASYTMGVRAEKTLDSGMSIAVVYTSAMMFTDQADDLIAGMNQKLFDHTIRALAELSTDFVTIPVKPMDSYLTIPMTIGNVLSVVGFIFIAAVVIFILGIVIWAGRRKK